MSLITTEIKPSKPPPRRQFIDVTEASLGAWSVVFFYPATTFVARPNWATWLTTTLN
jgi:hypothetical protein